jgi:hypothetical protein
MFFVMLTESNFDEQAKVTKSRNLKFSMELSNHSNISI